MTRDEIAKRMREKDNTPLENLKRKKIEWENQKWNRKGTETLIQPYINAAAEETGFYNVLEKYGSIEKVMFDDNELLARAQAAREIKDGLDQVKAIEENFRKLPIELMQMSGNSAKNWYKNSEEIIKKWKEKNKKFEPTQPIQEENKGVNENGNEKKHLMKSIHYYQN